MNKCQIDDVVRKVHYRRSKEKSESRKQREEKWRKFADLYMASGNAIQAYLEAGYGGDEVTSRGNASRLARHPYVVAYIERKYRALSQDYYSTNDLPDDVRDANIASEDEILMMLTSIIRDPLASSSSKIRAAESLARIKQGTKDETETSPDKLKKELQDLLGLTDDDELPPEDIPPEDISTEGANE